MKSLASILTILAVLSIAPRAVAETPCPDAVVRAAGILVHGGESEDARARALAFFEEYSGSFSIVTQLAPLPGGQARPRRRDSELASDDTFAFSLPIRSGTEAWVPAMGERIARLPAAFGESGATGPSFATWETESHELASLFIAALGTGRVTALLERLRAQRNETRDRVEGGNWIAAAVAGGLWLTTAVAAHFFIPEQAAAVDSIAALMALASWNFVTRRGTDEDLYADITPAEWLAQYERLGADPMWRTVQPLVRPEVLEPFREGFAAPRGLVPQYHHLTINREDGRHLDILLRTSSGELGEPRTRLALYYWRSNYRYRSSGRLSLNAAD